MNNEATELKELQVGDQAPDFTLNDQYNNPVSPTSFSNNWIILYFYPKDNTPGCTTEAIEFSNAHDELRELGAVVMGVSPDSTKSHESFCTKHNLNLPLLSDAGQLALQKYGVWKLKKMYGKEYWGVERSTFLIDPDGIIRHIWRKVNVKGHVSEVKMKLKELKK